MSRVGPTRDIEKTPLDQDAKSVRELALMDIVISCQGGDFTNECFPSCVLGWKATG